MTNPRPPASLSVLTPSYQYATYLSSCLRSVRRQTTAWPVQHVIVDDGSSDGSWDIIRSERPNPDDSVLRQDNQGLSRTLTTALGMATGDVICWLNADDFHLPWTYAQVARAFAHYPDATIVYGDTLFVDDQSRLTRLVPQPAFDRKVLEGGFNMFQVPSVFWRRDALPSTWAFDESMLLYMDLDLWLAITRQPAIVVKVDAALSVFRRHASQVSATVRASDARELNRLAHRYGLEPLHTRDEGGWTRRAHGRHAFGKVMDGGAWRQLRTRRFRGVDLDWTRGAQIPRELHPPTAPRLRVTLKDR